MPQVITNDGGARRDRKEFLASKVQAALEVKPEAPVVPAVEVTLPENYDTLSSQELYGTLVMNNKLSPELANDVVSIVNGFAPKSKKEFNIQGLKEKVVSAPASKPPMMTWIQAEVPANFESITTKDLYHYLTTKSRLTADHANDVIDILYGRPQKLSGVRYKLETVQLPLPEMVQPEVVERIKPVIEKTMVNVDLPEGYENFSDPQLFSHLRDEIKLPIGHADDVISILKGFTQRTKNVEFNITGIKVVEPECTCVKCHKKEADEWK